MLEPSIFTKIINGEIPSYKIYEDDKVIAFLDLHPQFPGHTLVVPKIQIESIWDLDDKNYEDLLKIAKRIAINIQKVINPPRVGMVVEGFGVPHVHVHLIPIYKGNDLKKPQDLTSEPDHKALAEMALRLKM